ncbi:MAG: phosphoglycolate phosphatase [Gammaproteobacteria bacterium]|nr:phosphoglycolate phosphatase [Gammaproteobacteria bacterium]
MYLDKKPELVAFDLDGTLVDSAPDIAHCIDLMFRDLGLHATDLRQVRNWMGDGVERLIKRALTGDMNGEPAAGLYAKALDEFLAAYAQHYAVKTKVYPGAEKVLKYLIKEEIPLCCITNKRRQFTEPLLERLKLTQYFACVVCGDDLPERKPDPKPLLHAATLLGANPKRSLMVGDSANDVEAARAAGFKMIAVSYGYNQGVEIGLSRPDFIVDSLSELPHFVYNLF